MGIADLIQESDKKVKKKSFAKAPEPKEDKSPPIVKEPTTDRESNKSDASAVAPEENERPNDATKKEKPTNKDSIEKKLAQFEKGKQATPKKIKVEAYLNYSEKEEVDTLYQFYENYGDNGLKISTSGVMKILLKAAVNNTKLTDSNKIKLYLEVMDAG